MNIITVQPEYSLKGFSKVPRRVSYAHHMTRVVKLGDGFSENNCEVWMKMDDETSFLMSGNKIRKLEYVFNEILEKSSSGDEIHVISFGTYQSNQCRALTTLCRRCKFIPHLFLTPPPPTKDDEKYVPDGNYFLMDLMKPNIRWIKPEEKENMEVIVEEYIKNLKESNRNKSISVHVVPPGASNAIGCFGYIECLHEIIQQTKSTRIPDYIFVSCGSVGTVVGLCIGIQLFEITTKIIGVLAGGSKEEMMKKYEVILKEFNEKYDTNLPVPDTSILELLDGYIGLSYETPYVGEAKMIKRLAQEEGIVMDSVYNGKGFFGMIEECKNGKIVKKGSKVLFILTGGVFEFMSRRQTKNFYKLFKD